MNAAAILKSHCSDNERFTNMWIKAFDFWNIRYGKLCVDDLSIDDLRSFEVLVITGMEHISDTAYRLLDRYILRGGKILISGDLPNGFSKYFNGMMVKKIQRSNVHRCIRIKNKDGFQQWDDGEILFFTGTFISHGLDYITDGTVITDADIPAVSEEMTMSEGNPGLWRDWKESSSPSVIIKRHGEGKILYTPFALGAMTEMYQPHTADSIDYLYAKQNHGLYLFIRSLLMSLTENYKYREPWPDGTRCVVSITGDVHDYTGIAGREDREWNDMRYNFDLLKEYGLEGKASYYVCGEVARKHPDVIREGLKRGFELCPHTFQETQYAIEKWDYNRQREDIIRCINAFENAAPGYDDYKKGFRTHGYQSNQTTRDALLDLGYEYIADMQAWETTGMYNPDFPEKLINFAAYPQFISEEGNKGLLEIPDTYANDHFAYRVMKMSPAQAFEFWKKQFDKAYHLGGLFQACLHPYISLKEDPEREKTYRGLIEYILSHSGVSFMTMREISEWWKKRDSCNK